MPKGNPPEGAEARRGHESALVDWMDRQYKLSAAAMLRSISAVHLVKLRPGFGQAIRPIRGAIVASPVIASYDPDPDYFFHWLRDSALVVDALGALIDDGAAGTDAFDHIGDFLRFSLALGNLDGRTLLQDGAAPCAVDPKFQQYMRPAAELSAAVGDGIPGETRVNPDGTLDVTRWARPQHDGPALRALAVLRLRRFGVFDNAATSAVARALVAADLAFTHRYWTEPSFDIWEEELGHHYYTRLVQHAALADGAAWMEETGDISRAQAYRSASLEIARCLDRHWDSAKGFYLSRIGAAKEGSAKELDIATILAVVHARREDGPHSTLDPRTQATLRRLESLFAADYPINRLLPRSQGPAMGRYAGDRYYSGGAYYFSTLAAAEFFFRLAGALARGAPIALTPAIENLPAGPQPPDRRSAFDALMRRGDGFIATVRDHTPASGDLSEQFDRATGEQTSAKNLAWSHAAFVTAAASRKMARNAMESRAGVRWPADERPL